MNFFITMRLFFLNTEEKTSREIELNSLSKYCDPANHLF